MNDSTTISYFWNNVPHTTETIAGSVNRYLELMPDTGFVDNAVLRRAGLRARTSAIAGKLTASDAMGTLQEIQYRTMMKMDNAYGRWVTNEASNSVLTSRLNAMVGKAYSLNANIGKETQLVEDFSTTDNIRKYGCSSNVDYAKSHVNVSNGVATFRMWKPDNGYGEMRWTDYRVSINTPIPLKELSTIIINITSDAETTVKTHCIIQDTNQRVSRIEIKNVEDGSTCFISNNLRKIAEERGISENCYISSIIFTLTGTSYGWHSFNMNVFSMSEDAWKEDFTISQSGYILNWYYTGYSYVGGFAKPIRECPESDTDVANFHFETGYSKLYTPSQKITGETPTTFVYSYLYIKYKTDLNTDLDFCLYLEYESSGTIVTTTRWMNTIGTPYPCTNDNWYIRCIRISDFTTGLSNAKIINCGIKVNEKTYTTKHDAWVDYIYISHDLDGDGNPDLCEGHSPDEDIDGDGMKGSCPLIASGYEWDVGQFTWNSVDKMAVGDNGGWQDPVEYNNRFAIIIGGKKENAWGKAIWPHIVIQYQYLKSIGYSDENIIVIFGSVPSRILDPRVGTGHYEETSGIEANGKYGINDWNGGKPIIDYPSSINNEYDHIIKRWRYNCVEEGFQYVAERLTLNDLIFVTIISHGSPTGVILSSGELSRTSFATDKYFGKFELPGNKPNFARSVCYLRMLLW